MDTCQLCGCTVRELHPIPPDVKTRALIEALEGTRPVGDLELCGGCINALMSGASTADLVAPSDVPPQ